MNDGHMFGVMSQDTLKQADPFAEAEIAGDNHAGALMELNQQMGEKRPASRTERQVAEFIEE